MINQEPEVVGWARVNEFGVACAASVHRQSLNNWLGKDLTVIELIRKSDHAAIIAERDKRIAELEADAAWHLQRQVEQNQRIDELERRLETANSALRKANELHFGVRMRRIYELERQVGELRAVIVEALKRAYLLFQPVAAPEVTVRDVQLAVHQQAMELAQLLEPAAPQAPAAPIFCTSCGVKVAAEGWKCKGKGSCILRDPAQQAQGDKQC